MEDEIQCKKDEEVLAEIYRNSQLALQSISNALPETEDEELRKEMQSQHEGYEKISGKACVIAKNRGIELKEPNPMKKMRMWGSIKMNTLTDNSPAHIADMMLQGTVMGITALRATMGELPEEGNEEIIALLKEMIETEETFEKRWKAYI